MLTYIEYVKKRKEQKRNISFISYIFMHLPSDIEWERDKESYSNVRMDEYVINYTNKGEKDYRHRFLLR